LPVNSLSPGSGSDFEGFDHLKPKGQAREHTDNQGRQRTTKEAEEEEEAPKTTNQNKAMPMHKCIIMQRSA